MVDELLSLFIFGGLCCYHKIVKNQLLMIGSCLLDFPEFGLNMLQVALDGLTIIFVGVSNPKFGSKLC